MIIVTGAAGFIGSVMVGKLNNKGFTDIVPVDDFSNPAKELNLANKAIREKVDRNIFFEWLDTNHRDVDFIFHLGARTDTTEFDMSIFDKLNLNYSKQMWQACVKYGIPLVYASTIALMWIAGIEFNVVTLTAIILALGLLLDDAVVVMENIERHYREKQNSIYEAVLSGTREIMFADFSGTVTTMIALSPILFVGGYPQTVFRPLVGTLLLALTASYIISITAVGVSTFHPVMYAVIDENYPENKGRVMGLYEGFGTGAILLMYLINGYLIRWIGIRGVLIPAKQ